jgi:hypothetical protein
MTACSRATSASRIAETAVALGVDLDLAALMTELPPASAIAQRAGRVNRLASAVAARTADAILSGLTGATTCDEVGNNRLESRSATGFAPPGTGGLSSS